MAGGMASGDTYFEIVVGSSDPPGTWANATGTLNREASNTEIGTAISLDFANITDSL
jgi:hypothetical protein